MNLYIVGVKTRSHSSDIETLNIVAANTTRASELALGVAKRMWSSPEITAVAFDRKIHKVAK